MKDFSEYNSYLEKKKIKKGGLETIPLNYMSVYKITQFADVRNY
jgi:hypothetical protein